MAVIFWAKSYNVKGQPQVFSIPEINIIPLGVSAISSSAMPATLRSNTSDICLPQINIITIFTALLNSWISDSLPRSARWPGMIFASTMAIIFPIALAATPVHPPNKGTRWALYCKFTIHPSLDHRYRN